MKQPEEQTPSEGAREANRNRLQPLQQGRGGTAGFLGERICRPIQQLVGARFATLFRDLQTCFPQRSRRLAQSALPTRDKSSRCSTNINAGSEGQGQNFSRFSAHDCLVEADRSLSLENSNSGIPPPSFSQRSSAFFVTVQGSCDPDKPSTQPIEGGDLWWRKCFVFIPG